MTLTVRPTATALTADLLVGMQLPGEPDLSPDGRLVAFRIVAVSKPKKQKQPRAAIWVAPTDGSAPARRWTAGTAHDSSPRFSPDGRWLGFLSDRAEEGEAQVYRTPIDGGEAQAVTRWKGGVDRFAWSPDGRLIAFVAADESFADEHKEREESGDDPQVWGERLKFHRIRLISPDGGDGRTLTPADRHVTAEAWSPDGRELVAALAPRPDLDAPAEAGVDLVRFPLDGSSPRLVCHVPVGAGSLTWTADGGAILFTAWEALAIPSSRAVLRVAADGGTPRCLTAGLHGCVVALRRPARAPTVLCMVAEGLTTRLYALDPKTGDRRPWYTPAGITPDGDGFATDAEGRMVAIRQSGGSAPMEMFAGDPARSLHKISDANPPLTGICWARQEPFTWRAPDGREMDGLLLRPPDASSTPPGVVLVHGGPYGRWADGFNGSPGNWAQWLALDGYAVFLPNPRGGMGHGHAFAATVAGEVGMADWLDVASGTDAFLAAGHADPDRLGIGGWSQGGFMTAWAIGGGIADGAAGGTGGRAPDRRGCRSECDANRTGSPIQRGWSDDYTTWRPGSADRFRCGVDGAGPTDWGSMATESDVPTFEAMLGGSRLGDGVGPHRHALVSPISYAGRIRTPLLILHGENDRRVPVGQAIGFFHELRRRSVPVELVLYPREPHGIGEEGHQRDLLGRVREWYRRWLR
jgi:dipeptidyl aminopeptidase/acylaminoacyl peptidase